MLRVVHVPNVVPSRKDRIEIAAGDFESVGFGMRGGGEVRGELW